MSVSTIEFVQGAEIWTFTPARNLAALRADDVLPAALRNTFVFVAISVAAEMAIGIALAIAVGGLQRGKRLIRTIMIRPILVPPVAIGSMWSSCTTMIRLFNQTLVALHLMPQLAGLDAVALAS